MSKGYSAFAYFYDALTENISYKDRAEYFDRLIKKHGGTKNLLLDLACGTGSLSEELSRLGYDVIGVDNSPEMLSEAMDKKIESGLNIQYLCQDMTEIDMFGTIDVTICALDSLNHLQSFEDIERTISRVSLFCEPKGLFIFDVNTPYKHEKILGDNTFVYDTEQVYCVWQNELQTDEKTVEISLDFFIPASDDAPIYERESEQFTECAYSGAEWEEMLKNAGFSVLGVFDGYTENPLTDASERAVYAVRKD